MQVGSLYSCKWKSISQWDHGTERGWAMLLFLGSNRHYYHFYDILRGQKCVLDDGLIKHCKEIKKETACTQ